jgi:hypothetical protein
MSTNLVFDLGAAIWSEDIALSFPAGGAAANAVP